MCITSNKNHDIPQNHGFSDSAKVEPVKIHDFGSVDADTHLQRSYVQHDYHDHYHDPISGETACSVFCDGGSTESSLFPPFPSPSFACAMVKPRRGPRGGVAEPFPVKLYEMLSRVDDEGVADVVSWQPHGRCFVIRAPKRFLEEVLPKYFKQSKLTSFQRQVNLYGFSRLTTGKDRGGYYHELFLRGRPDLCKLMIRQRVKGTGRKAAASPATEPDFYAMESCYEKSVLTKTMILSSAKSCQEHRGNGKVPSNFLSPHNEKQFSSLTPFQEDGNEACTSFQHGMASYFPQLHQEQNKEETDTNKADEDVKVYDGRNSDFENVKKHSQEPDGQHQSNLPSFSLVSMISSIIPGTDRAPNHENPTSAAAMRETNTTNDDTINRKGSWQEWSSSSSMSSTSLTSSSPTVRPPSPLTTSSSTTKLPNVGDKIFFEGLSFHYLDSLVLEDL